ncbi:MAG: flippase-like domain-containing protein [Candidatus Omnitrophota bacterium]|nr:MAG: flippase-like domain-containing protein [Candidatus Omnitrophota bacterium]
MKGKIGLILRVGISVGLIAFLLWSMRDHFPRIAGTLGRTAPILFVLAVLFFIFDVGLVLPLRLKLLFTGEGLAIPFSRIIQLTYIGYFFNNFMPTAVGGDIVKAYYVYKQTNQKAKSFISVFMDRFVGLFSFVFIAIIALFFSWENIDLILKKIVLVFSLFFVIAFLFILNSAIAKVILNALSRFKLWNIGEKLSKVYRAVHEYRNKKSIILIAIGISAAAQSIYFSMIYLLARSLGAEIPVMTVFLLMPIISVVSMLPSLGGLGLREGAIVVLFGPLIGSDNAFSISILLLAILLIVSLAGAVIYITASQFRIKEAITEIESYSV